MPKLNETQRQEIIQMYTSGEFKAREIAEMFSVNQQTVYNTLDKAGIKRLNSKPAILRELPKPKKAVENVTTPAPEPVPATTPEEVKETKLCNKCGKEINAEFSFCPYCGEKAKSQGELILDGLLNARAKVIQYVPEGCKRNVDKQLLDASEYLRFLMKKTGQF